MIRAYEVAGHVFHLKLSDTSVLWAHLGQYEPFETKVSEHPVFTLELNQQMEQERFERIYYPEPEKDETVINLYRREDVLWMEMALSTEHPVIGWLRTDSSFKSASLRILSKRINDAVFCLNNSMMIMFAFSTAAFHTLEMHASVIMNQGRGYLFLASSGTGKSTHSQQWLKCIPGSELLNDDNPIVRIWPDGGIIVYGSPWSGKTPCYKNKQCPVGAFVRIRRCLENKITKLNVFESYSLIYSSCSGLKLDSTMGDDLHDAIASAVAGVPSFVLDCLPDEDAARVCHAGVSKYGK